jgi:integrase
VQGQEGVGPTVPEQQSNTTFNRHLERAGIRKVSEDGRRLNFHSLRYTFCTLLASKLPLQAVQRLMRHAQLAKTADLYLQLELDSLPDQVIELPALFSLEGQEAEEGQVA